MEYWLFAECGFVSRMEFVDDWLLCFEWIFDLVGVWKGVWSLTRLTMSEAVTVGGGGHAQWD